MSNDNTRDDYEVGYGRPPKSTQFQKGVSGNPRGRPKKILDFSDELMREARSFMTITENGRKKRLTKHQIVIKQLMKQAMTGNIPATRTYLGHYQEALRKLDLSVPQPSDDSWKHNDLATLTDEQLMMLIFPNVEQEKRECGLEHLSNAEFLLKNHHMKLLSSSTVQE